MATTSDCAATSPRSVRSWYPASVFSIRCTEVPTCSSTPARRHSSRSRFEDVPGLVVAEQLAQLLLVVGHAVRVDHGDEVPRGVAGQGRLAEVRILRGEVGRLRVQVGEVAAPSTGHEDLLARLVGAVDEQHLTAALCGGEGTHQPGGTCADDHNVGSAHDPETAKAPGVRGFREERMKGLEPSTFCMASRRSSQLSYIRAAASSIATRIWPLGSGQYIQFMADSPTERRSRTPLPSRKDGKTPTANARQPASRADSAGARRAAILDDRPGPPGPELRVDGGALARARAERDDSVQQHRGQQRLHPAGRGRQRAQGQDAGRHGRRRVQEGGQVPGQQGRGGEELRDAAAVVRDLQLQQRAAEAAGLQQGRDRPRRRSTTGAGSSPPCCSGSAR